MLLLLNDSEVSFPFPSSKKAEIIFVVVRRCFWGRPSPLQNGETAMDTTTMHTQPPPTLIFFLTHLPLPANRLGKNVIFLESSAGEARGNLTSLTAVSRKISHTSTITGLEPIEGVAFAVGRGVSN